jgi:sigma-B regulation protein RsbU (phosphoserine phosphatase)
MERGNVRVLLRFIAGPSKGNVVRLEPGKYLVGRKPSCDILVKDAGVSRQHSRIWSDREHWFIEDLGSQNGTFVNGQRVTQQRLFNDDVIWVGVNRILVSLPGTSPWKESVTISGAGSLLYRSHEAIDALVEEDSQDGSLPARKLSGLQAILEVAGQTLDPAELLEQIVGKLLDVFAAADSVGVLVQNDAGTLEVKCRKDRIPEDSGNFTVPAAIMEHVIRDRRGVLLGEPGTWGGDDEAEGPSGSAMGAPLRARDVSYGVIYVSGRSDGFSRDDVNLLTSIAAHAGMAIHAAGMHQELARRERVERDVGLARQIQRSLLPEAPPAVTGLDIAAHYEAAYQIGGDFYDFIWHDEDHLAFVIGDVSGKSISAALYMARVTGELRSRTGIAQTPRRLLHQVNDAMAGLGDDGMFATLIYAVYDFETRALVFSNAGHLSPLLRRGDRVSVIEAESARVAPLGVLDDLDVGEASIQLQPGDLVVLSTDGIHEARNAAGEEYGEQRLARCVGRASGTAADVIEAILVDVAAHTGDAVQRDDVTIVTLAIGEERARRSGAKDIRDRKPARARAITAD